MKWFKGEKGYGFVELADGAGDAFLHANALQASGHESVPAGAKLVVQVGQGAKGAQVTRVLEVDTANIVAPARTPRPGFGDRPDRGGFGGGGGGGFGGGDARPRRAAPDPATAVPLAGKVKWFDETKGFGFVASEDGGKDVFVHISVLGAAGITRLTEGQPVMMKVVNTPKGREAISLSTSAVSHSRTVETAAGGGPPPSAKAVARNRSAARHHGGAARPSGWLPLGRRADVPDHRPLHHRRSL